MPVVQLTHGETQGRQLPAAKKVVLMQVVQTEAEVQKTQGDTQGRQVFKGPR